MAAPIDSADAAHLLREHHDVMTTARWREIGGNVRAARHPRLAMPAVRTSVSLSAPAATIAREIVDDVVTTMGEWSPSYRGGSVVVDGVAVRALVSRTHLPFPCADREDRYAQHRVRDDDGTLWELSCALDDDVAPAAGCARARIALATKRITPITGQSARLDVLWVYDLGGVLGLLPVGVLARMIGTSLADECARLTRRYSTP